MSDFLQAPHQPCHSREINKYKVTTRNLLCLQHYYFILGVRHPYSIVLHLHRIKKKWGCFSILTTVYASMQILCRRTKGHQIRLVQRFRNCVCVCVCVAARPCPMVHRPQAIAAHQTTQQRPRRMSSTSYIERIRLSSSSAFLHA